MASPGSVQAAPAVPTPEPRHSTRLVLATVGLAILAAVAIFVGGRGWAGPHSVTAEGTPTDTFDRSAGAGLGSTDDGRRWQTPAGPWTIDRERALPLGANPMPTAWFAVTEGSGERGAIGVTVAVPQDGAGLVAGSGAAISARFDDFYAVADG